ncbi:Sporulation_stage III [Hexamita inflata]|uniref:Transcriptional regulator SpoIIID n=1 Tax=Hexamita inflata TaxID=28002 RepID=A0ABP1K3S5_9EUKA
MSLIQIQRNISQFSKINILFLILPSPYPDVSSGMLYTSSNRPLINGPTKSKREYKFVDLQKISQALQYMEDNKITLRKTSELFEISKSTLHRYQQQLHYNVTKLQQESQMSCYFDLICFDDL